MQYNAQKKSPLSNSKSWGEKKKREEVDSIVSCFPQISVLKPERCQSGLVSHIHQDQQTFAGYTVYFILNSQWNPVDSPFFPSWSRLMSQFTAHWSSIPPPAAGDLLWVSETYERDGGRCVAQLSTKSKSPDMQQQLRTECSTRLSILSRYKMYTIYTCQDSSKTRTQQRC